MNSIEDIGKKEPKVKELLESAGFFNVSNLKGLSLDEITEEVVSANRALEVFTEEPTSDLVRTWLEPLSDQLGFFEESEEEVEAGEVVTTKELLSSSFAIPLSAEFIDKHDVDIDALLPGRVRLLDDSLEQDEVDEGNHDREESETSTSDQAVKNKGSKDENEDSIVKSDSVDDHDSLDEVDETEEAIQEAYRKLDEILPEPDIADHAIEPDFNVDSLLSEDSHGGTVHVDKRKAGINKERIMTMDAFRKEGSRIAPLVNENSGDLTRATRKETNKGVDPSSKRFIRGVLHTRAASFKFSLYAYLMFVLCMVAGVVMPLLTLLDKEMFFWAPYTILLLFVGVLIYFMFTGKASCPICNQKQFAPKNCLKHRDAHKLPVIGYMLPTALHAIYYRWFKCIFCGTSVRLKE